MTISDHGNAVVSKFIQSFGLVSVGTGGGVSIAQKTGAIQSSPLSEWALIISIVGGCLLIVKYAVDIYFSYKRNKREEDLHNGRSNNGK